MAERVIAIEVGDQMLHELHAAMPDQNGCWHGGWVRHGVLGGLLSIPLPGGIP